MTDRHATLWIGGTPPSYNTLVHAHWRKNHRVKQQWEEWCWLALLQVELPKGLQRVTASALLHFKQYRRRDEGNFRVVLEKALGDALVKGGWLDDDTPDHYRFERLRITCPSSVAPKTEVGLAFR